jgi:hypothetical protein
MVKMSKGRKPVEPKGKLLDHMRLVLRLKHMSYRTEEAYILWAKRFIFFHHKRHPKEMEAQEIRDFLTHMAVHGQVATSTQNVALQALVFLYRAVLKQDFPELGEIERAKCSRHVPVVFTRAEVVGCWPSSKACRLSWPPYSMEPVCA